jgi:hypothetical protein
MIELATPPFLAAWLHGFHPGCQPAQQGGAQQRDATDDHQHAQEPSEAVAAGNRFLDKDHDRGREHPGQVHHPQRH